MNKQISELALDNLKLIGLDLYQLTREYRGHVISNGVRVWCNKVSK